MRECDYYAPGTYNDPDAPWNQHEPAPVEVDAEVTLTLCKTVTVETTNYVIDEDGVDLNDSFYEIAEYCNKQHKGITELLAELEKYIKGELAGGVAGQRKWELQQMLEDCEGWSEEDFSVDDFNVN